MLRVRGGSPEAWFLVRIAKKYLPRGAVIDVVDERVIDEDRCTEYLVSSDIIEKVEDAIVGASIRYGVVNKIIAVCRSGSRCRLVIATFRC